MRRHRAVLAGDGIGDRDGIGPRTGVDDVDLEPARQQPPHGCA